MIVVRIQSKMSRLIIQNNHLKTKMTPTAKVTYVIYQHPILTCHKVCSFFVRSELTSYLVAYLSRAEDKLKLGYKLSRQKTIISISVY